jgi:hypothetical protein
MMTNEEIFAALAEHPDILTFARVIERKAREEAASGRPSEFPGMAGPMCGIAPPLPAEQDGFEAWAKREGAVNLTPAREFQCEDGRFPATYYYAATETAWRAWANKPALDRSSEVELLLDALQEHHLFAQLRPDGDAYRESETYRKTTAALAPFLASDHPTGAAGPVCHLHPPGWEPKP